MDIISHGIYSVALNKTIDPKRKRLKEILESFLWGMMPDALALGPSFVIGIISGTYDHHSLWNGYDIARFLYSLTHSFMIFLPVLGLIYLITRRWYLPMLGWGFHILLDIPFHTSDFYPTPFLFPLSDYVFPFGIIWRTPIVWMSLWILGIAWLLIVFKRRAKAKAKTYK